METSHNLLLGINKFSMTKKRLYRSSTNKVFAGIVGGLGDYFDIDPTILRLLATVFLIFSGILPALVVYIIALFIVPLPPHSTDRADK